MATKFVMHSFTGHGVFDVHLVGFPEGLIGAGSAVLVTICELRDEPPAANIPFIGSARMTVNSIAPNDDGTVLIKISVEWPSDLPIGLTVVVVN